MKKFERNELSFLFLWVINPVIIVFYQNCSMTENSFASSHQIQNQKLEVSEPSKSFRCSVDDDHCLRFE